MSTAAAIIDKARGILADEAKTRWTDTRLLDLLNEGIDQILIDTKILLEESTFVELQAGLQSYNLASIALKVTRVEWNGENIPLILHKNMDNIRREWETVTGDTIQYAIHDQSDLTSFKVYPIPNFDATRAVTTSNYGTITGIYGGDAISMVYEDGIPTGATLTEYLEVFYIKKVVDLIITDECPLDDIWDKALSHYIAAHALRINQDTMSRQLAAEELSIYTGMVAQRAKFKKRDSSNTSQRTAKYVGVFNE